MPEQARPARPRSGLDFQIHNLVIIFKSLTISYSFGPTKIIPDVPDIGMYQGSLEHQTTDLSNFDNDQMLILCLSYFITTVTN